jgi:hypothetical protein
MRAKTSSLGALFVAMLLQSGCATPAKYPIEFHLMDLEGAKNRRLALPQIASQIIAENKEALEDDRAQGLWAEANSLFAMVPLNLADDGITDYLVYPAEYLPSMSGAHSIACWVFKGHRNGDFELVAHAQMDDVRILPHKTNGFRDIDLVYYDGGGAEVYSFRYDGRHYQKLPPQRNPEP